MGLAVGKVELSDYDYNWPKQFEEEKANLRQIFGDSVPIEHVGSTSIEGISAKPIIDIAVAWTDSKTLKTTANSSKKTQTTQSRMIPTKMKY